MAGGEVGGNFGPERTSEWLAQDNAVEASIRQATSRADAAYDLPAGTSLPTSSIGEEDRPSDDAILKQENAIRAEMAEKLEYVGNKEPLSVLAAEYEKGNPVFRAKIENLATKYSAIRRARGDGNCFFRSFMFSYLEHILETKDGKEAERMKARLEHCKEILVNIGYAEFTWEDFLAVFTEQLESCQPGSSTTLSLDTLVERCRDSSISNYVVMFFRFVTSSEIQHRADFFAPFIFGESDLSVLKFCQTSVDPMGEESDHIHITALTDALQVPVRVVYLDGSSSGSDPVIVNHHDFVPETNALGRREPYVVLLYRPGHYDILYPRVK